MKRTFAMLLTFVLTVGLLCVTAQAKDTAPKVDSAAPVRVWGTVTRQTDGGLLVQNSNDSDPYHQVILRGESILCLNAVTGEPMDMDTIKDGDMIYAWIGPAVTASLPPQATAILILANIPADYAVPLYHEVISVTAQGLTGEGANAAVAWTEVATSAGQSLRITKETRLTSYETKNTVRLEDLVPGTRMLVWTDRDGAVTRVLVFPYTYAGYLSCGADGTVTLNGRALTVKAKMTEGEALLPLRAVAEAMGLEVQWVSGKGAVVEQAGKMVLTALPGKTITGVDNAGESFAVAGTCVLEAGTTYLSAAALRQLLNLFAVA